MNRGCQHGIACGGDGAVDSVEWGPIDFGDANSAAAQPVMKNDRDHGTALIYQFLAGMTARRGPIGKRWHTPVDYAGILFGLILSCPNEPTFIAS
jgi:hypothetical protein